MTFFVTIVLALAPVPARAGGEGAVAEARESFARGTDLAKDGQWGAALAAFERSSKLVQHPWTTYNIAVCERALGQYLRARRTFSRALAERRPGAELPDATVADIERFIAEIDRLVASVDVTVVPTDAALAIDGAPLEAAANGTQLAGTLPAGPGHAAANGAFKVVVDPGTHVLLVSRTGFADAAVTVVLRPGDRREIRLVAEQIPAMMRVSANERAAVVMVDGLDVGSVPVEVSRGPGLHHVSVRKPGFDPYEVDATVKPGQHLEIAARLRQHKPSVLTRWWFWGGAVVVVGGVAAATYALTRPEPQRPPVDGGGLGWAVRAP